MKNTLALLVVAFTALVVAGTTQAAPRGARASFHRGFHFRLAPIASEEVQNAGVSTDHNGVAAPSSQNDPDAQTTQNGAPLPTQNNPGPQEPPITQNWCNVPPPVTQNCIPIPDQNG